MVLLATDPEGTGSINTPISVSLKLKDLIGNLCQSRNQQGKDRCQFTYVIPRIMPGYPGIFKAQKV